MVDIQKISEELNVRQEVLARLITSFSKTLQEKLKQLDEALSVNDVMRMRAILHEVRGTSGNLRLKGVEACAKSLHEAVKAGAQSAKLASYLSDLKSETQTLAEDVNSLQGGT